MGLFSKNPNEVAYVGGKKNWADVIKNSGPGELLVWRQPEEDFNTNSTLIVYPSEEAIFYKGGTVEQVFNEGTYKLSTENYPFISRFRNALTGGISTFNCVVYFVRKAHSMEILWGTDSPIQVLDPIYHTAISLQARGSYKVQIKDGATFINKMIGNNIPYSTQDELNLYFRNEYLQYIKTTIAQVITQSNEDIYLIQTKVIELAQTLQSLLGKIFEGYGLDLVRFSISAIDLPETDPAIRQKLEAAKATRAEANIFGNDYGRFVAREILSDVANNPGAGGVAAAGAGLGLGMGAASMVSSMSQQLFSPQQQGNVFTSPQAPVQPSGRFVQKSNNAATVNNCPSCQAEVPQNSKFCSECGATMARQKSFCPQCGTELAGGAKFCAECGAKI